MKITLASIFVNDQEKALKFYTEILGFKKKHDIPLGENRWLTITSSESPPNLELVLEPNKNPVAKTFQEGLYSQGIPATSFESSNIYKEFEELKKKGVHFTSAPQKYADTILAIFDDTCGNLIQIHQQSS